MDVELAEPAAVGSAALLAAVRAVAGEPAEAWGRVVDRVVSSPSRRALLVARPVAEELGAALHADDRLQEMDFGAWEGRPWSGLPRAEIDAWAADPLRYRPGGGESVEAMLARVRRAWTGLASSAGGTLVVCHAGPIRCLLHVALGMPLLEAIGVGVAYGEVVRLGGA